MSETESKIFEVEEQLDDATKCSICTETFKEPKMLSCVHTFCKICLQTYAESLNKLAKDEVPCPICRKKFQIPESGLDELQNNIFVQKLIDIKRNLSLPTSQNLCESCSDEDPSCSSEIPNADVFCTDCQLKLCKKCHQFHLRSKILKNHKLVKISNRLEIGIGDIKAAASWFCPKHNTKISDVYCSTCKDTMCYICFLESHKTHEGLSVESASLDFQKATENNINRQLQNVPHLKQKIEKLNENKSVLIQTFEKLEAVINKRREELKTMVDAQSDSLLSELKTKQEAALKKMIIHEDEIETLMISIDSYKTYFQQLTTFGSSISICKALEYLSRRVDELQKQCDLEMKNTLQPPNLRLKAETSHEVLKSFIVRIIGELEGPIDYSNAPKSMTKFKLPNAQIFVPGFAWSTSSNSVSGFKLSYAQTSVPGFACSTSSNSLSGFKLPNAQTSVSGFTCSTSSKSLSGFKLPNSQTFVPAFACSTSSNSVSGFKFSYAQTSVPGFACSTSSNSVTGFKLPNAQTSVPGFACSTSSNSLSGFKFSSAQTSAPGFACSTSSNSVTGFKLPNAQTFVPGFACSTSSNSVTGFKLPNAQTSVPGFACSTSSNSVSGFRLS